MPYRSPRQRRFIFAAAARGEAWARKFIRDSGEMPPPVASKLIDPARRLRSASKKR